MTARFVKFTDEDGDPVGVNVDHIVDLHPRGDDRTTLYLDVVTTDEDGDVSQEHLGVRGTLDEVMEMLNGEPAPQPHPSTLMPQGPAPWAPKPEKGGES